jgi:hypothetical protein
MPGPGAILGWLLERAGLRQRPAVPDVDAAGGDDEDAADPAWDGGWWRGAQRRPAHAGRVGGVIRPWAVVVHTTDVHPSDRTWAGMMGRLQSQAGEGNAAHFWIGRDPGQGVVQSVSVDRNANHAGGKAGKHGWFVVDGQRVHPNRVTFSIEVNNAGLVVERGGKWYARSGDGVTGAPLPAADVEPDPKRPGYGWHRPTDYQLGELALLLEAIGACPVRVPSPAGWSVLPHTGDNAAGPVYGGAGQAWAPRVLVAGVPVVGHVTLDPRRKGDPWPPLSRWLQGRSRA